MSWWIEELEKSVQNLHVQSLSNKVLVLGFGLVHIAGTDFGGVFVNEHTVVFSVEYEVCHFGFAQYSFQPYFRLFISHK